MVKVSVVIPIYNAEKYLEQCIDSIVNQTLSDIEIILINDGSKDGSGEICKKYLSDSRVIYYEKENEGLAAARQDGIDRASGEYIGFIDSDDWAEPDMYEKMYLAAKSNNSDVVLCNCFEYDEKKRREELRAGAYNKQEILAEVLPKTLIRADEKGRRRNMRWSNCLRIYKKKMLDDNHIQFGRKFRRCQDLPFTFECMLYSQNFYYLDEFLYHNRQDAGSLSRGYTKNMWNLIKPLIEYINKLSSGYSEADLSELAASTSFFLTMDCILNEFKPDALGFTSKVKHISEIIHDDATKKMVKSFDGRKLNKRYYKVYYRNIKRRNAVKLIFDYHDYLKAIKRFCAPVLTKITETKLYKRIRRRK